MSDSPLILGVSGLRGIVGESLTPEVAVRYAACFGAFAKDGSNSVVVGWDGRRHGEMTYHAVISGLVSAGFLVHAIGVVPTPTVGVAVDRLLASGGIIVTASHNPQEWNGIKCLLASNTPGEPPSSPTAAAPSASAAQAIVDAFLDSDREPHTFGPESTYKGCGVVRNHNSSEDAVVWHCLRVGKALLESGADGSSRSDFVVVADSVNSAGSKLVRRCRSGSRVVQLHGDGSGIFPHTPEPTRENLSGEGGLCDAVPGLKADVGFAQDPDADRLAIVDETGHYIGEEYTLVLCAAALMEGRKASGKSASGTPVFVANLSTSRMIDDVAKHYGAKVVRTAVGEANVVEAMKRLTAEGRDVVMGGEGNGGVIWAEVTYVRDSLSAMALTLALMARTGKKVSELVAMIDAMGPGGSGYAIVKRKAPLASKADADPAVKHLSAIWGADGSARVDTQDGVRVDWDDRGVWAHVRASNTEPIMRVIVEAPTPDEADRVADEVQAEIARA